MGNVVWAVLDNWDTWGVFLVLSAVNLLVLLVRTRFGFRLRGPILRFLRRVSPRTEHDWLNWKPLVAIAAVWLGGFTIYNFVSGQYGCLPNGLLSDPLGELDSGRAFWMGRNPFEGVAYCGSTLTVPYGLSAVLLDALGALGGIGGILVLWSLVALSIVPLTWLVSGPDREYLTVYVCTSVLFVPLVTAEFSGATNAIVAVTFLLFLYLLQRRREFPASIVGGFLATARFPSLFPVLGGAGAFVRSRLGGFLAVAGTFALATVVSYAVWGGGFVQSVFLTQVARRTYSLNFYGIFLLHNALPASVAIEGAQAGATLALTAAVFVLVRSPVRAVGITIVGVALITPFLAYNFLVWLLPVALAGARARWWLWAVATVGTVNSNLALDVWAAGGTLWPGELLDLVVTALLLGLLLDLWREERRERETPARSSELVSNIEPSSRPAEGRPPRSAEPVNPIGPFGRARESPPPTPEEERSG